MIRWIGLLFLALWLAERPAAAAIPTGATSPSSEGLPSPDQLRRVTDSEFEHSFLDGYVLTHLSWASSHPQAETFFRGGVYLLTSGPYQAAGTYQLRDGVLCVHRPAANASRACRLLLTDGHGRFFSQAAPSKATEVGESPPSEMEIRRPGPPTPK